MRWKSVGVYLAIAVGVMLLFGISARAATRTVSWQVVTTYTDGSPVEVGNAVTYSVWRQDSATSAVVQLANRVSSTSQTFDDSSLVKGRVYNFWAQAHVATGASSDNSAAYSWTMPQGKSSPPQGLLVQ
jgi:hypothetical protein